MTHRRAVRAAVAACIVALACTGCWDRVALEDIAWVQALGVDLGAGGLLRVTFEIGIPKGAERATSGPGGGRAGMGFMTMTVDAETPLEAFDLIATIIGRRVSLMHTQLYVFGEEYARADVRSLVQALERYREVRGAALVTVARGCRAEDILRVTTSPLEVSPSRYLETILQQYGRTGLFEATRFKLFVMGLEGATASMTCPLIGFAPGFGRGAAAGGGGGVGGYPSTPPVGERVPAETTPGGAGTEDRASTQMEAGQVPYVGGGPVGILGSAVFQGGKMVGTLDGGETRAMLMIRGLFRRGAFSVPDPQRPEEPQYALSVDVTNGGCRTSTRRRGDRVEVDIHIRLNVYYVATRTQTDYGDPRNAPLAERAIAEYVKRHVEKAVSHAKELGVDVFGFGQRLRRTFLTWSEYEEFSWPKAFPESQINTSVDVHIRRFGMIMAPPRIPRGEIGR